MNNSFPEFESIADESLLDVTFFKAPTDGHVAMAIETPSNYPTSMVDTFIFSLYSPMYVYRRMHADWFKGLDLIASMGGSYQNPEGLFDIVHTNGHMLDIGLDTALIFARKVLRAQNGVKPEWSTITRKTTIAETPMHNMFPVKMLDNSDVELVTTYDENHGVILVSLVPDDAYPTKLINSCKVFIDNLSVVSVIHPFSTLSIGVQPPEFNQISDRDASNVDQVRSNQMLSDTRRYPIIEDRVIPMIRMIKDGLL